MTMDSDKSLEVYMSQLQIFRKSDADRDALVTQILKNYGELKQKYDEAVDDLSNEKDSRRRWQGLAGDREHELKELKQASGSNNFVMAVIDGDGALFQDTLYSMGKDGGSEAAFRLQSEIKKHLKKIYPEANVSDWNVAVQVFLNLQGLARSLHMSGIIDNVNDLSAFGRSFCFSQPLFNFVDVGSGKERADHKIRETLRLYMPIAQCKHIFFAPCHDNGYIPVLETYKNDPAMARRLTLIETRPSEPGFRELGLEQIRMDDIFRAKDLQSKQSPAVTSDTASVPFTRAPLAPHIDASPVMSPATPGPITNSAFASSKLASWATVGKKVAGKKVLDIAPKQIAERPHVLVNIDGHRLDADLPRADFATEARFMDRVRRDGKYCNNYHILGDCANGQDCDYQHGERLSPEWLLVLKSKARNLSCSAGGYCRDVDCTFGHVCKFGKNCNYSICYFTSTHKMEMEPAKRVFEDETEEWLSSYLNRHRS